MYLRIIDWYSPMNLFVRKRTVKARNNEKINGHDIYNKKNILSSSLWFQIMPFHILFFQLPSPYRRL